MKNKISLLFLALIVVFSSCSASKPQDKPQKSLKKVSILGDSYSTFLGQVTPAQNPCYYGTDEAAQTDVRRVEEMWWYPALEQTEYKFEYNNSYSGSTICNTGYSGEDFTDISFITRMKNIGDPDIILLFGGTNDSWAGAPVGEYKYTGWVRDDFYKFRPAFSYLLDYLKKNHPRAKIYQITNSNLDYSITTSIDKICEHYQIPNIQLQVPDSEKPAGHPSVAGMQAIRDQVWTVVGAAK